MWGVPTPTRGWTRPATTRTTTPTRPLTYIVRAPDSTPNSDTDNPIINNGACRPKQFAPWAVDAGNNWYQLLHKTDGYRDNRGNRVSVLNGVPTNMSEINAFHNEYRQWVTICSIPANTVNSLISGGRRDFIVQVLSNAPYSYSASANTYDVSGRGAIKDGRNHFALRSGLGNTLTGNVDVFANGRLPMHAASKGANTTFYLAKVGPENAGRKLSVDLYDVGDAAATGTITIQRPAGAGERPGRAPGRAPAVSMTRMTFPRPRGAPSQGSTRPTATRAASPTAS